MSAIVEIQERIQLTMVRLAQLEKAVAEPNPAPSLYANIRGLEKVLASLESEFARIARSEELEICRYRLLPPAGERPALVSITKAWTQYQALFSSVFEAVVRGRKKKSRTGKEMLTRTQFGFGYTFSGSIGVVLTLPNLGVNLETGKALEMTTKLIFEMAKAQSEQELLNFVKSLGVPPVAKMADWAEAHLAFDAGAGVEWQISATPQPEMFVQIPEFRTVKKAFDTMTDPIESVDAITGSLRAVDVDRHTFKMRSDSGEEIKGTFEGEIATETQRAELPQHYEARIKTTKKIHRALEKEQVSHVLVQLVRKL